MAPEQEAKHLAVGTAPLDAEAGAGCARHRSFHPFAGGGDRNTPRIIGGTEVQQTIQARA